MSTTLVTKKRRSMQLLWSKLDCYLKPIISQGLVLAVSGGPDSRALLESIARWRPRLGARILVVSMDHGVRVAAHKEAKLTLMRAKRLGFKTKLVEIFGDNNLGEQELRQRRYEALIHACKSINSKYICTAHHQDDNAEGYLMALLGVGGGTLGAAMGVYEPMGEDYILVRPFVALSKKNLLESLSFYNYTDFAVDNLDQDRAGQRAYVRHEIMPELLAHEPHMSQRLDYFAQQERHKRALLNKLASALVTWLEHEAVINLKSQPEPLLIELAAKQILQKYCKNKDLRQAKATLSLMAGLDHSSKKIILKGLEPKKYALPGAMAYVSGKEIVIKRV